MDINNLIGFGLGSIMQSWNNYNQTKQYKNLMDIQSMYQKDMLDFQNQKYIEMANTLDAKWQVKKLKEAGLNVGLMMKGAPGVIGGTNSASVGAVPQPQNVMLDVMAQQSNIELMQAQADKLKAEAEKIRGIDTDLAKENLKLVSENITNTTLKNKMDNILIDITNIEKAIKENSYDDALRLIAANADNAEQLLQSNIWDNAFKERTLEDRIDIVNKTLANLLLEADVKKQGIELSKAQINKMSEDIKQGYMSLSIEKKNSITNFLNYLVNKENAETNKLNANTRVKEYLESVRKSDLDYSIKRDSLLFEQFINDIPESDKLLFNTLSDFLKLIEPKKNVFISKTSPKSEVQKK